MTTVEENKITSSEKTKDPRKVELGKRLAKISREAKERKRKLRESTEKKQQFSEYIDFKYTVGGITILGGLIGIYFAFKRDKREVREEKLLENNISHENNFKKEENNFSRKRCLDTL